MAHNRLFYILSLVVVLVFHCFYTGWISFLVLILALCLPAFSLVFSLSAMVRTRVEAYMPLSCQRGEETALVLKNCHRGILPAPLCRFRFSCLDRMAGAEDADVLELAAWRSHVIALPTAHCGAYVCTLSKGRVYDYLGLFSLPLRLPKLGTLLVFPEEKAPEPLPNLSQFLSRSYRPKHGGGFSEIHDMRQYHPGDNLRDIHWKLSAKTDDLVVREAQEPDRGQTLLTLDLCGTRRQMDEKLDMLCWLSRWLLGHEVIHLVSWLDPKSLEPQILQVTCEKDLPDLLKTLLAITISSSVPTMQRKTFLRADWRYHIEAGEAGT